MARSLLVATVSLLFLISVLCSTSSSAAQADPPVTLTETGDTVLLANGILTATLSKSSASVRRLKFKGFDMLNDGYYSMDGGANYRRPSGCRFEIKASTPALVDVAMT